MKTEPLIPQLFLKGQTTQLPAINFFDLGYNLLPSVYRNASNFVSVIRTISDQSQYIYDVIRSLVNVVNLNSPTSQDASQSVPVGVYLHMLASLFGVQLNVDSPVDTTIGRIRNKILFVNSRGRISDFYNYFVSNGLISSFNNDSVEEIGNATLYFQVPFIDDPLASPNPINSFIQDMNNLKSAGIKIIVFGETIPYFQLASLPTDDPPEAVEPGNAGFASLTPGGDAINGGFFLSL